MLLGLGACLSGPLGLLLRGVLCPLEFQVFEKLNLKVMRNLKHTLFRRVDLLYAEGARFEGKKN